MYMSIRIIKFTFILILVIGLALIISENIPNSDLIKDRVNYFKSIENSIAKFASYVVRGPVYSFFNEPLWLVITLLLNISFGSQDGIYFLSIINFSLIAVLVAKKVNYRIFIFLIILLHPIVMDKYIIHLRQGLAIGIMMLCWTENIGNRKTLFGLIISSLIHSSFFFVLLVWLYAEFSNRLRMPIALSISFWFLLSFFITINILNLASSLGARQSDFYSSQFSLQFGIGIMVWTVILVLFLIQNNSEVRDRLFVVNIIIFYLISYMIVPSVGARVLESCMIIIFINLINLKLHNYLNISVLAIYSVALWFSRLGEPILGFGA